MAAAHAAFVHLRGSFVRVPKILQSALLGMAWVLFNILLIFLGYQTGCPITCAIFAGSVDGLIASLIVVAVFSHKFQAGVTGLVSGYGFNNLANGFAPAQQAVKNLHDRFDGFLKALPAVPGGYEELHHHIEISALWIAMTATFVVVAALIVQWIRTGDGTSPAALATHE